jgi:DUF4097 and DUF4098 domain-containing protein YvlB
MLAQSFFPSIQAVYLLALGLLLAALPAPQAHAQILSKTFQVAPDESEIEVTNQTGSIKVSASSSTNKVVINAKPSGADAQITAKQTSEGHVKVEVTGLAAVELELSVPAASKLDLLCYKCAITVANVRGPVHARTMDGSIVFSGLRSPRVEAHSTSGNINFAGEVLPHGSYKLKSFAGRVDATLPANADFKLHASSFRSEMDFGNFPLKFKKQGTQIVEGACGEGRATLLLWTQEGSLHLHRKP